MRRTGCIVFRCLCCPYKYNQWQRKLRAEIDADLNSWFRKKVERSEWKTTKRCHEIN